ncbi:serine protease [Patescibacteria group bacterium]|nr:serine protease [Patescibacteria group bacterium]
MFNIKLKTKKVVFIVCFVFVAGAIGGFLSQIFVFPYILQNSYFAQFQFIRNFKEGKIVVNTKEQIFIQENVALQNSIEKIEKAVVGIKTKTDTGTITGTGLIVASDGLVITLADLVPAGGIVSVFSEGKETKPQILKRDLKNNLALLKISELKLTTCGFCDSEGVKLGERVFLLGILPSDFSEIVNEGIVKFFNEDIIKTNIFESSSLRGSPLFNIDGNLVGLCRVDSFGKVIAIPIQKIKDFVGF